MIQRIVEGDEFLPTPEQIAQSCTEIQKGWTPQQEKKRRGLDPFKEFEFEVVPTLPHHSIALPLI